jgi:isopentenyl-diphosphate Delta-isomerase
MTGTSRKGSSSGDFLADELIDIVDENNKPLGITKMKSEAHKKGLWHRAAHVWIYNSKNEILLQLRAKDKEFDADRWDLSAAGHVAAGEDPLSTALREMKEELGLAARAEDLEFMKIRVCRKVYSGLTNNEFQYVYSMGFEGDISGLKIQEEEVQAIQFIPLKQVQMEIETTVGKYPEMHKDYWIATLNELGRKLA